MRQIELGAEAAQEPPRAFQDRQRRQAEEVELHQPGLLDMLHRVLGDQEFRARIAIQRHQLDQRPVADHHPGGVGGGVAIQTLDLQRDLQHPAHRLVVVAQLLQPRLGLDRFGQGDRLGRVVRDQLGDLVHLAERQAEHPADVAHRGARLQLAEGDDLRDPVGAVFLAHVVDHPVAPLLAEVDVEIGHRHALGVQEPLEQQIEAHRVEIGDRQRPGGERPGARPAPRPHRDAVRLRPLDEIGDDQEIPGEAHPPDHAELVLQPFRVPRAGGGVGAHRIEPADQALGRHGADGFLLALPGAHLRAARQQRLAALGHHRAAPRDRERVVAGIRQVGEQHPHVGGGLEPALRADLAALGVGQLAAFGDAQQRLVRLVHRRAGEIAVVGGHERQPGGVGQRDQPGFHRPARRVAMAVQLDRDPVGERLGQRGEQPLRLRFLAFGEQAGERPAGAAGQQDQPLGMGGEGGERDLRLQPRLGLQEAARGQGLQIGEPGRGLRQQHQRVGRQARGLRTGERDLAADDRLDPLGGAGLAELQRAEQVGGVGDGDRGHPRLARERRDLVGLDGALAERIGGMDAEMDEIGV